MYQIRRIITPAARIKMPPNSGASFVKRNNTAEFLMDSFYKEVSPEFEKNGYITKNKLEEIYAKLFPNVDLTLLKIKKSKASAYGACVESKNLLENNTLSVFGYDIQLPFGKKAEQEVLRAKNAECLFHETSHLCDFLTNPKYRIKTLLSENTYPKRAKYWEFDGKFLYPAKDFNASITPEKDLPSLLKDNFAKLWEDTKADSYEKIEILQNFRHDMKTEQIAYPNGVVYRGDFAAHPDIQAVKKNPAIPKDKKPEILAHAFDNWKRLVKEDCKTYFTKTFHFQEKITTLEDLLKAELAKVRAEHAEKFAPSAKN